VHLLKELVDARSVEHERRRVGEAVGIDDTRPPRVALAADHAVRKREPAVVADWPTTFEITLMTSIRKPSTPRSSQ
jgi:hypothetical protein